MNEGSVDHQRTYETWVEHINPLTQPEPMIQGAKSGRFKALVLLAYASGTTPQRLNPAIKEITALGVPVFLLANAPGDVGGIRNDKLYMPQARSGEAGALALQKVNINHLQEVLDAIQDEVDVGKGGKELGEAIHSKFAYKEGEEAPKPDWEIAEKIEKQREHMEQKLRTLGLPEDEVQRQLHVWGGEA